MADVKHLTEPIIKNNPIYVLFLGLCPALAVTTTVKNGAAMGLATLFVLTSSNIIVSLVRNFIPKAIRIPCYIVVIAAFVTMVEIFMAGFAPALSKALGIFIALIVVNCIILGRAEAFASKNKLSDAVLDGLGMGFGFGGGLVLLSAVREVLGQGTFLDVPITQYFSTGTNAILEPMAVFILPPGAFIVVGLLLGYFNMIKARNIEKHIATIDYQAYKRAGDFEEEKPKKKQ